MYAGYLEEGDTCPECKEAKLQFRFSSGTCCSCHISAPCAACVDQKLTCDACGFKDDPEPHRDVPVAPGLAMREYAPRPLDPTKIDWRNEIHTSSSMIKKGVYPEGVSQEEVRKVVNGTFGGRFEYFADGKFKFIAYTD